MPLMDKNSLTTKGFSPTRAKSFKVKSPTVNYTQYVKTVKAYALAGLPFEHIANAGDFLGDVVERNEVDAPLQEGWQKKQGEITEEKSKILAWQNRGETVSITRQISSPAPVTGLEVVSVSQELTEIDPSQKQIINVVEGIAVINNQPTPLPNHVTQNPALENNPFLKAIPKDIKY